MDYYDSWIQVSTNSDLKTISNILLVSKEFNKLDSNLLWRILLQKHFNISDSFDNFTSIKYKYIYHYEINYFNLKVENKVDFSYIGLRVINPDWDPQVLILPLLGNQITEIPENWNPQARVLYLGYNQIRNIPKNWNPQIYELYLDYNQIRNIPENWNPQIHNISLDNNYITEIPENWNPQVHGVYLSNNQITKIPEDWNPQAYVLSLSSNQIRNIPENWNPQIHELYLNGNEIDKESLKKFKNRNPNIILYI